MKEKIERLSQINSDSIYDISPLFDTNSSYVFNIEIDGDVYVINTKSFDDLPKAISDKKMEILSKKRDDKINNIIDK